jgi:hypothetical protein
MARADGRGFGEDLLHPRVGLERLALFDADRGEQTQRLGIHRRIRLLLYDCVDVLVEGEIDRANGVQVLARQVDEVHLRRIRCLCQGIDAQVLLDARDGSLGRAKHAQDEPVVVRR